MSRRLFWESVAFALIILFTTAILVRMRIDTAYNQKVPLDLWTGQSSGITDLFPDTLSLVALSIFGAIGFTWVAGSISRLVTVARRRWYDRKGTGKPEDGQ